MKKNYFNLDGKRLTITLSVIEKRDGKPRMKYEVSHEENLFKGEDFFPSYPFWKNPEGRGSARELLFLLGCLGGREFSDIGKYSKEQILWSNKHQEALLRMLP